MLFWLIFSYAASTARAQLTRRGLETPNKKTEVLKAICEKHSVDPFEAMVIMAKNETDFELKFQILKEICSYIHPKRKQVELSSGDEGFKIVIEDYTRK